MKEKANIIFNARDIKIINEIPNFTHVYHYPSMEMMDTFRSEWGKIRTDNGNEVLFHVFSQACLDSAAVLNGGKSFIGTPELTKEGGRISITIPKLDILVTALQMIMRILNEEGTVYPPEFKIWTESTVSGDFFLRFERTTTKVKKDS